MIGGLKPYNVKKEDPAIKTYPRPTPGAKAPSSRGNSYTSVEKNRISSKPSGAACLREGKGLLAPPVQIRHPKRGKNSPFGSYGHRSEFDASRNCKLHISRTVRPNLKCKECSGILKLQGVQPPHLLTPPTRRSRIRRAERKATRAKHQTPITREPSIGSRRVRS